MANFMGIFILVLGLLNQGAIAGVCDGPALALIGPSIQTKRIEIPIKELRARMEAASDLEGFAKALVDKDGRGKVSFKLEGFMRLYRGIYGKRFSKWRNRAKTLEDAVGRQTFSHDLLETAKAWNADPAVQTLLQSEFDSSWNELKAFLIATGWSTADAKSSPRVDELEGFLATWDWQSPPVDRKSVGRELIKSLKALEKLPYDVTTLAEFHKMRREIRWLLINMQLLNGLFALVDSKEGRPLHEFLALVDGAIAKSPFGVLPENPEITDPFKIPRHIFLGLSQIVAEIGKVKDQWEGAEGLEQAYLRANVAKDETQAKAMVAQLVQKLPGAVDTVAAAKSIKRELKRTGILQRVRKMIEDQI